MLRKIKNLLKTCAFKLQDILMILFTVITFIMIGIDLILIIYYQLINYEPLVVITACCSLFLMIYTNKGLRG